MDDLSSPSEVCTVNEIDPEAVAFVQERALEPRTIERLSRLFSALADPTRLKVLHALTVTKELCVCDLAVIADLSVSAVSHQLRLLRDRDLVHARRDGRMVFYSLADEHVSVLMNTGTDHANES
ncbi:MAG TPA: metalloregulator ArsR/SmtB family transcription factor [Methylomirabilota bacterium]|nr:metalloregulator ArsR/SmtB family transcription factor [Methylomirabilota bacterium]